MLFGALDFALVLIALAGAAGFLVWHLGFRGAKPACHDEREPAGATGHVVLGGSLARGLEAARKRAQK